MAKDPYEVLGVARGASMDEVRKAYRELIKKYHPDQYKGHPLEGVASEKTQEINAAYDAITNANQQTVYDDPQDTSHDGAWQSWRGWDSRQTDDEPWNSRRSGTYYRQSTASDCCTQLSCLCCADSCCECCGGDLCTCC